MKKALILSFIAAAFLAACGSSGSGGTVTPPSNNGNGPPPTPSPTATPNNVVKLVQQALEPVQSSALTSQFFLEAINGGAWSTNSWTCGVNPKQTTPSTRQYNPASGTTPANSTLTVYPDSKCTANPPILIVNDQYTSQTINGVTYYNDQRVSQKLTNGQVTETSNRQIEWTPMTANNASEGDLTGDGVTTPYSNGHSIQLTQTSSSAWTANIANASRVWAAPQGCTSTACDLVYANAGTVSGAQITAQPISGGGTMYTYTGTHNESLWHGRGQAFDPLTPALPTPPSCCFTPFTISAAAGSAYSTGSAAATIQFDNLGNIAAINVTATTGLQGLNLTVTFPDKNNLVGGTVTDAHQNPQATFEIDIPNGDGTLTYTDGTTAQINNFIVQNN